MRKVFTFQNETFRKLYVGLMIIGSFIGLILSGYLYITYFIYPEGVYAINVITAMGTLLLSTFLLIQTFNEWNGGK